MEQIPVKSRARLFRNPNQNDWLASLLFTILFFLFSNTGNTVDDGGIVLRYLDNFAAGHWFCYNPSDGPVWGISDFWHGLLAGSIAASHILSPLHSLFAANFLGLVLASYALLRFIRQFSALTPFRYCIWASVIITSDTFILTVKQGLEAGLHLGIVMLTLSYFMQRARHAKTFLFLMALSLSSKLDTAPIVLVLFCIYAFEQRKALFSFNLLSPLYKNIALYLLLPLACWFTFTMLFFGTPISQTAIAKSFQKHTFGHGMQFIKMFMSDRVRQKQICLLLMALPLIAKFILAKLPANKSPYSEAGLRFTWLLYLPALCMSAYLSLYYFYNPREQMIWYSLIPQVLLLLNAALCLAFFTRQLQALFPNRKAQVIGVLGTFACLVVLASLPATYIRVRDFYIASVVQEGCFKRIGEYVHANASPADTLIAEHGYVAQRYGYYFMDYSGLNYKPATQYAFDFTKLVTDKKPQFIADLNPLEYFCKPADFRSVAKMYSLVQVFSINYPAYLDFNRIVPYFVYKCKTPDGSFDRVFDRKAFEWDSDASVPDLGNTWTMKFPEGITHADSILIPFPKQYSKVTVSIKFRGPGYDSSVIRFKVPIVPHDYENDIINLKAAIPGGAFKQAEITSVNDDMHGRLWQFSLFSAVLLGCR